MCRSFELGGEKKTKGAALTFVSVKYHNISRSVLNTFGIYTVMSTLPSCPRHGLPFFVCVLQSIMRRNTLYAQANATAVCDNPSLGKCLLTAITISAE
jgi:hypothetical protein